MAPKKGRCKERGGQGFQEGELWGGREGKQGGDSEYCKEGIWNIAQIGIYGYFNFSQHFLYFNINIT